MKNNKDRPHEPQLTRKVGCGPKSCVLLILILSLLGTSLLSPGPSNAQEPDPANTQPPPTDLPGQAAPNAPDSPDWYLDLPPSQPGFPVAVSGGYFDWGSSPTLVDLDGNGSLEIVLAGRDLAGGKPGCGGMIYAYHHNGSLMWQTHVRAAINSTPSAADLTGDGHPDIVVGMGGWVEGQCWDGGVVALDGLTGQRLWTFNTQDWLNHRPDGQRDGVFSTPAIGDVNGDGQPEIAFGAWDQCIYLLDRHGQPLWGNLPGILPQVFCGGHGFYNEDTIWSSPALADVTGDGRLEIIIGADISPGNWWNDPRGGYLYVLNAAGNTLAREWMDEVVFSSPAVADLDRDGALEIVVGTGAHWANKGRYVSAFDYAPNTTDVTNRLALKWRRSTAGRVTASPAIADLNKDGWPDVTITSSIGEWGETGSMAYAWRGRDGASLFQRRICNYMGQSHNTFSSPSVADVDGDSWPEVIFGHAWEVAILNHDGTYYTDYSNPKWPGGPEQGGCARDHAPDTQLTYWAREMIHASPAVGDLDGDGDLEIVVGGHDPNKRNQGMLFAWTGHRSRQQPAWPTWRFDERHTGNPISEAIPPTNPTKLHSPTHIPGRKSTSSNVTVSWSGAADEGSGVAGYSVVWDRSPKTLPDTTLELWASTQSTSSILPDGRDLYFHLRTADRAGNWAAGAVHLGPFWIDSAMEPHLFVPMVMQGRR